MDSLLCSGELTDMSVKQDNPLPVDMCSDSAANEQCTDAMLIEMKVPVACTSTFKPVSVAHSTSHRTESSCYESCDVMSLTPSESNEQKRDFPLLSLPLVQSFSTPFSPQTPCSRFESCVLQLNGIVECACLAGAVLCRWHNIIGPQIVYVWTTTVEQRSWLAAKNVLSYIARGTLAGEVNRDPHDEVKFFASSDSAVSLATVVFSCRESSDTVDAASADVNVYSISVIVPYSELADFLKLKSVCLEWLSRAVLQLRVLLSQVRSLK